MNFSLDELKKNTTAIIRSIHDGEENGILINMGISVGTEVTMIWPSVLNRPMVIQHGENQLLAVRKEVAQRILVELKK
jgi:Fe2+ transport system protein FeoA